MIHRMVKEFVSKFYFRYKKLLSYVRQLETQEEYLSRYDYPICFRNSDGSLSQISYQYNSILEIIEELIDDWYCKYGDKPGYIYLSSDLYSMILYNELYLIPRDVGNQSSITYYSLYGPITVVDCTEIYDSSIAIGKSKKDVADGVAEIEFFEKHKEFKPVGNIVLLNNHSS